MTIKILRSDRLRITVIASLLVALSSCYGGPPGSGPNPNPVVGMVLESPSGYPNKGAAMKNDEGVSHFKQEHWDTSAGQFREAITIDPKLAQAHFNLGLALDQMGQHSDAAEQFKMAKELAPDDPQISENPVLKKHL